MSKLRNASLLVVLTIVSSIVGLLLAEAVARVVAPEWAPRTGRLAQFWRYDPIYGWAHVPGKNGEFNSYGFHTTVSINSHGYRGPERPYERSGDARRVVVLGDSMVFGFGVEESELFTHLLDRDGGGTLDVVNLGVSGYSTDQELLVYRNEGRKYHADTVVLVVSANDVADNVAPVAYLIYGKPVFRLEGDSLVLTNQPVPETPRIERALFELGARSFVLNEANHLRESWAVSRALSAPMVAASTHGKPASRPFPKTLAEQVTVRLIAQMGKEVEEDGARFIVVLVDGMYGGRKFSAALRALGLEVVELDEVINASDPSVHISDQIHWNGVGHAIVARTLAPVLNR